MPGSNDGTAFGMTPDEVTAIAPQQQQAAEGDPAVWTLLGEAHPGDTRGQLAVASTFANRQRSGGYGSYADVVNDPANGYQAWQTAATRAKVQHDYPVNSPQYQAAASVLDGLRSGQTQPLPYTHYHMTGMANPPAWGTGPGDNIGGNTFYTLPDNQIPRAKSGPDGTAIGLTADEVKAIKFGAAPASPAAEEPGSKAQFNFGPGFGALSKAAVPTFTKILAERNSGDMNAMRNADQGSAQLPYYVTPGTPAPAYPGIHWVDANGLEHVNPGGLAEKAEMGLENLFQGSVMDSAASGARLGLGQGDPMMNAFAQSQGGPSALQNYQAANQAFTQQGRNYAIRHLGDPTEGALRFTAQAVPAAFAAAAVPELEAPAALAEASPTLGTVGRVAATGLRNALQGVAATAPSVGANPNQSVSQQLMTGALGGFTAPVATEALGKIAGAATGVGRTVAPEVADLAAKARDKYGIDLASAQVMAANGDRKAAVAYSNLNGSDPKVYARNAGQRQAWQRGVTNTYGDPSGDISPEALSANRARVGGGIGDIANRTTIADTGDLVSELDNIAGKAKGLGADKYSGIKSIVDNIKSAIQPDGTMSGAAWQAQTGNNSMLHAAVEGADSKLPGEIMAAMQQALQKNAAAGDADALRSLRFQYKNLMTVAKAAQNQNNIGIDGVLKPNSLNTATTSQFKDRAFSGAGDLDELNAIRNKLMTEPPNSFTADRARDFLAPLKAAVGTGSTAGFALSVLHRPEALAGAATAAGSALAGYAGKAAFNAIKRNKVAGSAENIINRSMSQPPGTVNALNGLRGVQKAVEIPLSALAGVRGVGALQPAGAQ